MKVLKKCTCELWNASMYRAFERDEIVNAMVGFCRPRRSVCKTSGVERVCGAAYLTSRYVYSDKLADRWGVIMQEQLTVLGVLIFAEEARGLSDEGINSKF